MSSDSECISFSYVHYCWDTENIINWDDAVWDLTIPVKSTSACISSCTSLTLSLCDKRQQNNGIKEWICFRLSLKLWNKTKADLKTSQRHTPELQCLCLFNVAHNYNLYSKCHKWKYRKLLLCWGLRRENRKRAERKDDKNMAKIIISTIHNHNAPLLQQAITVPHGSSDFSVCPSSNKEMVNQKQWINSK